MISEISHVRVPEYLSQLLCLNAPENKQAYAKVGQIIFSDKFLPILMERSMGITKSYELEKRLAQFGWRNFRNQITAIYLEFYETRKYSFNHDMSYVQDLITFEDRFEDFCHPGSNRIFLLGLYLKLNDANLQQYGKMDGNYLIDPPRSLDKVLRKGVSRQHSCDYLLIMSWYLLEILGEEKFIHRLTLTKGRFMGFFEGLSDKEKEGFLNILLDYCSSIGQDDVFFYGKV